MGLRVAPGGGCRRLMQAGGAGEPLSVPPVSLN